MKKYFSILLLIFSYFFFSQNQVKDSISEKICNYLNKEKMFDDRSSIYITSVINDYYTKHPDEFSEKEFFLWVVNIQENCSQLRAASVENFNKRYNANLSYRMGEPKTNLKTEKCNEIFKDFNAFYRDLDGKITEVKIFDDTYFETFQDGTYSQLNFIPKDNCQYRLEYVKSNNEMKSFINNMIDIKKTKYILLDENENYFTLAVSGINLDTFTIYEFYKKAQNVPKVNKD